MIPISSTVWATGLILLGTGVIKLVILSMLVVILFIKFVGACATFILSMVVFGPTTLVSSRLGILVVIMMTLVRCAKILKLGAFARYSAMAVPLDPCASTSLSGCLMAILCLTMIIRSLVTGMLQ